MAAKREGKSTLRNRLWQGFRSRSAWLPKAVRWVRARFRRGEPLRPFYVGLVAFVALGLTLVVWAAVGANDGPWDAMREIGGAIIAGAALAALVVIFEDRREDQRDERAELREKAAARRAWRREMDLQWLSLFNIDLPVARDGWRSTLDHDAEQHVERWPYVQAGFEPGEPLWDLINRGASLLRLLGDQALSDTWSAWLETVRAHNSVGPPPLRPRPAPRRPERQTFQGIPLPTPMDQEERIVPPKRDPEEHVETRADEELAWRALEAAVVSYIDREYPNEPLPTRRDPDSPGG